MDKQEFGFRDALVLEAASMHGAGVSLKGVLAYADYINHDILSYYELNVATEKLSAAGLVTMEEGEIIVSERYTAWKKKKFAAKKSFGIWKLLEEVQVFLNGGFSEIKIQKGSLVKIAEADYRYARDLYLNKLTMDKNTADLLKKIYHHSNGDFNREFGRVEYKIQGTVSREEIELLKTQNLLPNRFEVVKHDDALHRLLALRKNEKLNLGFAAAMFLAGLSGEFLRGRQVLLSFSSIQHLTKHAFEGSGSCESCGIPEEESIDLTQKIYSFHKGNCWNESLLNNLVDLEDIVKYEKPVITKTHKDQLRALLDFIAKAEKEETPGQLEKRIAAKKLIPKTDKYGRYGILQTLAECGILPNDVIAPALDSFSTRREIWTAGKKLKTSQRSDIVLPLNAWRGKNGVNLKRAKDIFGI